MRYLNLILALAIISLPDVGGLPSYVSDGDWRTPDLSLILDASKTICKPETVVTGDQICYHSVCSDGSRDWASNIWGCKLNIETVKNSSSHDKVKWADEDLKKAFEKKKQ